MTTLAIDNLHSITTRGVSKALKAIFVHYGVPDTLVTDNGPQFTSAEFVTFAKVWGFEHITSSPRYPQLKGKAENAVKRVKWLFNKCRESGQYIGIPCIARLEQHPIRVGWNQPGTETPGATLQDTAAIDKCTAATTVSDRCRCRARGRSNN